MSKDPDINDFHLKYGPDAVRAVLDDCAKSDNSGANDVGQGPDDIHLSPEPIQAGGSPRPGHEIQGRFRLQREIVRQGIGKDEKVSLWPGVWFDIAEEGEEPQWTWICSLIEPLAHSRDRDNLNWGVLIEVTDGDNIRHHWAMPSTIGPSVGDGTDFRRELVRRGLRIAAGAKARNRLSDFITMWRPKRKVRCVSAVGWCDDAFVMPHTTYGGKEEIILQTEGVVPQFTTAGTLAGWRDTIARLCVGNSRLTFAVSAAFVGPLLRLAGEESGGVNFRGGSSIGKTTGLHAARSVWGVPLGSWRTTDNGAEGIAAGASDTFLNLDELGQADPKVIAALAYMLGNQRGKTRMTRNATAKAVLQWRVFFLSTGEISLADRLRDGGIKVRAGQEVRVLDIPADAGKKLGIFEELHRFKDAASLAEHIRMAADRNCGHAAMAFITYLLDKIDAIPPTIVKRRDDFIALHCPKDADGQVRRACGRFAMIAIAGGMATRAGITGWKSNDAWNASVRMFRDWLDARGGNGSAEIREGIAQVRLFLEQHGEARFSPAWASTEGHATVNRAGFRKTIGDNGTEYYVLPNVWREEVCKGINSTLIAKAMADANWLAPDSDGKFSRPERIPGHGRTRVYVILPAFTSDEESADLQKPGVTGVTGVTDL
jgi:putative DNA primase/helicase